MNVLSFEETQKSSSLICKKIAEPYLSRINEVPKDRDLYCIVNFRNIAPLKCGDPFILHQILNYLTRLGYEVEDSSVVPAHWGDKIMRGIF